MTGGSTQHRGVLPDIELPSHIDSSLIGESSRDTALPWDQIKATDFATDRSLDTALSVLSTSHEQRSAVDPDFNYLQADIAAVTAERAHNSVSLSLLAREQEREESRARELALRNERRAALGQEPVVSLDDLEEEEVPDILLDEAAAVVADMTDLSAAAMAQNRLKDEG